MRKYRAHLADIVDKIQLRRLSGARAPLRQGRGILGMFAKERDMRMTSFLESMLARAKADKQTIVLAEGDDLRTLEAAETILA